MLNHGRKLAGFPAKNLKKLWVFSQNIFTNLEAFGHF